MRRLLAALLSVTITGGCADEEIVRIERRSVNAEVVPTVKAPAVDDLETWFAAVRTADRPVVQETPPAPELEKEEEPEARVPWFDEAEAPLAQHDVLTPEEFDERSHYLRLRIGLHYGRTTEHRVRRIEGMTVEVSLGKDSRVSVGDRIELTRGSEIVGRFTITHVSKRSAKGDLDTAWTGTVGLPVVGDVAWTPWDLGPRVSAYGNTGIMVPRDLPDGLVLSIKKTRAGMFVAISVGTRDGVRVADEYHLSRGGRYVGRIALIRVSTGSAYGRLDERWKGQAFPPQVNDKAWTE